MSIQRCCPEVALFGRDFSGDAALFKALADPARATIIATLARVDQDVCVCDFTSGLGLNQSTVSHHLKILKEAGLVMSLRRETWGYYALADDARARLSGALDTIVPVEALV